MATCLDLYGDNLYAVVLFYQTQFYNLDGSQLAVLSRIQTHFCENRMSSCVRQHEPNNWQGFLISLWLRQELHKSKMDLLEKKNGEIPKIGETKTFRTVRQP